MSFPLIAWAMLLAAASGLFGALPPLLSRAPRGSARARRSLRAGQIAGTAVLVAGSALGLAGSVRGLFEPASLAFVLPWPAFDFPLLGLDALSAFFLCLIFFVAALASIYSLGYEPADRHPRRAASSGIFYGLLVAGLALLVVARHALSFLLGWETMALSAFFLIASEHENAECRRSSFLYLAATHLGTLSLFGMFALWRAATGSFELAPAPGVAGGALVGIVALALVGFGLKAGVMPLHFWLPPAHAAAPSHVSAMLSGVLLKMGVYGLARMLSLLPAAGASAGVLLLALGTVSALLGVAYALAQHDLKKLLAYHSVENVGIILMGLGLALLGRAWARPELVALGLGGCLLHSWNHGLFKSLLFLGAGAVAKATGTRQIDALGGLGKRMPWTAALFALGAVAICGLPPLNGFASELLVYLGLFSGVVRGGAGSSLVALAAPCLAMVGALALACFVKATGAVFLGEPRSPAASAPRVREAGPAMLLPMAALALACAAIGLAPALFAPALDAAIAAWAGAGSPGGAPLDAAIPPVAACAPLGTIGAVNVAVAAGLLLVGLALALRRRAAGRVGQYRRGPTWDCGYAAPSARMQYTASSFARGLVGIFAWALRPGREPPRLQGAYPGESRLETEVEDGAMRGLVAPASRRLAALSQGARRLQQGLTQHYVLYILVALAALLLTLVPYGELLALALGS